MKATWIAVGLLVLVALLQLTGAVEFSWIVWVVVAAAVASAVALDITRRGATR